MKTATKPSEIKPLQARAYVPNMQMRQVAEKLKGMPRLVSLSSNVSHYRQLGGVMGYGFIYEILERQMRELDAQYLRRQLEMDEQKATARRTAVEFRWLISEAERGARRPKGHDHPEWV